jgi:hypothetical protein
MSTGASNNIVHISFAPGKAALCKSRFACFSTTPDKAHTWPAICKRCYRKLSVKTQAEIEARREAKAS